MSDFRNFLNKQLEDPEFKAEWEALQPELSLVQAMIDARKVSGLTQKELSERTGIAQADISKLENGTQILLCGRCSALPPVWECRSKLNSFLLPQNSIWMREPLYGTFRTAVSVFLHKNTPRSL